MALLSTERLCKRFDNITALENVSVMVNEHDRIALVGRNGIGKSTLLRILAKQQAPDSGAVHRNKGLRIDFVEQELGGYANVKLRDFVSQARRDLTDLQGRLRELEAELEKSPESQSALDKYDIAHNEYTSAGGFEFETDLEITLAALGFPRSEWTRRLRTFSGGEQNRAALARALLGSGQLVLLDEPTNHLDIESTEWLEHRLNGANRAVIIVSHDREFLSNVVDTVWDLSFGQLAVYHNGFASYLEESRERREQQRKEFLRQKAFIEKTEAFIRKNLAGQKTRQAKSRRTMLAKLNRIEAPKSAERAPSMNVAEGGRSFAHILALRELTVGYPSATILSDISLDIYRGDRVGLVGPNGSGKTTLLRTLLGELPPLTGSARIGAKVELGYFDQSLSELDETLNCLEHLWALDPLADQGAIRSYLARFGLYGDETLRPVGTFSGGEKTKLSLALMMYQPANFLVFDEPTNHLDIESRQALEEALKKYNGAYIVVSHDRAFLNAVTDKTLAIDRGSLHMYSGSYSYYAEKRAEIESAESERRADGASEYSSFKKRSRNKSALERKVKMIASKICDHEQELAQLEKQLGGGIPKSDWEILTEISAKKSEREQTLLELYQEHENLQSELERHMQSSGGESAEEPGQ